MNAVISRSPTCSTKLKDRENQFNHACFFFQDSSSSSVPGSSAPVFLSYKTLELRLSVLGMLCDGQNRTLQDFLRNQRGRPDTVNIVSDVAGLLHHYRVVSNETKDGNQPAVMRYITPALQTMQSHYTIGWFNQ